MKHSSGSSFFKNSEMKVKLCDGGVGGVMVRKEVRVYQQDGLAGCVYHSLKEDKVTEHGVTEHGLREER